MTALAAGSVGVTAPAAAPAVSSAFGLRIITGLVGVLLAVLVSGFNENVTKVAMPDIRGAMGIGYDESTWLLAVYSATSISAMAFAPWCAATFSLRRFTLCAIGAFLLLGVLCPLAPNVSVLMLLRTLQGFAGGALPPMLMSVALRFLPPNIRLYGLGSYALTATFGPSFGTPLSAWWVEYAGWQWAFWQVIPLSLLAMACVAWGLPQDPLRLERFKQFDWRGLLLGMPGLIMLVLGLELGQRLNWFESQMIRIFIVGGLALLVLFFINEWSHPLPFFKLQLLKIRNLSHALLTLAGVLFVLLAVIKIPSSYLAQIQGYRPLETAPVMLMVAVPQLIALPLVVALCNLRWVDCRWVLATGLGLLALACVLGSEVTSVWNRENFYALQAIQIIAQPMAVIPLLMLSTGSLNPVDGPFASAWFNTVKGFSAVAAGSVLQVLTVNREHFHSMMLVDRVGNSPLVSSGVDLARRVHQQAMVLSSSDLYLCMAGVAVLLIVIIPFGPTRIYPPGTAVGAVK
ncbi:disulfide bond formation protein DsbA [Pseudomonas endophytica]|uniref:Disulfide bond formation protein DsbA n=1 Tax=Pseudomonas endophytica TaxID=1563157 RepID=A0A0Q0XRV2_9PSED|nr:MFS transporter [Pseudomonas endophytica]KQB52757.1 disulfide bond formation protein DsbA [Pseudomonas endophytica]